MQQSWDRDSQLRTHLDALISHLNCFCSSGITGTFLPVFASVQHAAMERPVLRSMAFLHFVQPSNLLVLLGIESKQGHIYWPV